MAVFLFCLLGVSLDKRGGGGEGGARRGFLFQLNLSEVARDEGFSQTNKLVIDFLFYIYLYIR